MITHRLFKTPQEVSGFVQGVEFASDSAVRLEVSDTVVAIFASDTETDKASYLQCEDCKRTIPEMYSPLFASWHKMGCALYKRQSRHEAEGVSS